MPDTPLTAKDFAKTVREKYPEYEGIPDEEITARIIAKYPEYKSAVARPSQSNLNSLRGFAKEYGLKIGSTTGGRHNTGSLHYSGNAIDFSHQGVDFDDLREKAFQRGFILRDERKRPSGQKVWGGPHGHLEARVDITPKKSPVGDNRYDVRSIASFAPSNEVDRATDGFDDWYAGHAAQLGLDSNPDAPEHHYDYRAAYKAGATPDASGHWPSQFKAPDHPNRYIDGVDTITGVPATRPRTVATRPADEFTTATGTVDEPIPPFNKTYTGALGQIGEMGPQAQQAYLQFVRMNVSPGQSTTVDKAAVDENLAQTFLKVQDFISKNSQATDKDFNRGLAEIGAEFLKDPKTKGAQLPRAIHEAMLSADYTAEEWAIIPRKLQNQIRAHRAQIAQRKGRTKAVQQLQSDIQVLGPTPADWYPDLDFHLRMKPGEFQSLTRAQQRKVVSLVADRVRADKMKREVGQEIPAPSVEEEIALRKSVGLPRRAIRPLNMDADIGVAPSREVKDWSDLIAVPYTPDSVAAIQRKAEGSLQKRESVRAEATASATPESPSYRAFLLQNKATDSPQMREQFGALVTKQYDAAQPSEAESRRRERVEKIGLFTNADGSWGGKVGQIAPSVFSGLASAGGGILKSIAMLSQAGQGQMLGTQSSDNPLFKLGTAIEKAVPEALGSNPDLEQEMVWGKLPRGAGNMIAFMAGGALSNGSKIAIALLGAGMEAPVIYEEIKDGGGSEQEALTYGLLGGGILGSTEIIGFTGALNALKGTPGEIVLKAAAKRAIRVGKAAGRDGVLNAIQEVGQSYGEGLFSGKRRSAQELWEAGLLGGILGTATTGALTAAATSLPRGTPEKGDAAKVTPSTSSSVREAPDRGTMADAYGVSHSDIRAEINKGGLERAIQEGRLSAEDAVKIAKSVGRDDFIPPSPQVEAVKPKGETVESTTPQTPDTQVVNTAEAARSALADEQGQPIVVYHQTTKEAEQAIRQHGFDLTKAKARRSDEGVPDGVFFKPTADNIFTDATNVETAQIAANLNIKNPLKIDSREELMKWATDLDPEYSQLAAEVQKYDRSKIGTSGKEYDALIKDATAARARLTELLKREGYDGVVIERDVGGPRTTKTYVALDPKQVNLLPASDRPTTTSAVPKLRVRDTPDKTLSQAVRAEGGIRVDKDKTNEGELARIGQKEGATSGLVNKNSNYDAEDMALRMAEDGYRGDWVDITMGAHGPQFNVDGMKFIEAVEMDLRGIKPILRGDKPIDFEKEYRAARPDEAAAHDAVVSLVESDEAGDLYMKVINGEANESEITEFRETAKNFGVANEDVEWFIREGETARGAKAERVSDTPQGEADVANDENITTAFKNMGSAITENLYRGMFERMQQGKLPAPFPANAQPVFEQKAKREFDAGRVKKWEDLRDMANKKSPTGESEVEERFAGIPILRTLLSGRPRNVTVQGLESEIPEVEARWKEAKGIKSPGVIAKAREGLARAGQSFTRHFPKMNAKKDVVSALSVDALRQYEAAPEWAKAVALDQIADITANLDSKAVDVMTRAIALPDIIKDVEAGLYSDKEELPFGYKSKVEVEADLAKFQKLVDATPAIQKAIARREDVRTKLVQQLVDMDLLPEKVLTDPRYYHRQVMEYFNAADPNFVGTGSSDVRLKKKGFQKGRSGGSDFNTRYQEAEFEWMAQAYSQIAAKQLLDRLQPVADIRLQLELEAKVRDDGTTWKDLIPDTHRKWQPEKGNHFFMGLTITERAMDEILSGEREFQEEDVRQALVVGGRKREWVIPKELATTLDNFNSFRNENAIEQAWVGIQSGWKQWVLLNPKRVIKYNLNNTSGDLDILLAYDPTILKEAPAAARDLWKYHLSDKADPALKAEMQAAIKQGVIGSTLTTAEIPDINKEGPFRLLVDERTNPLSAAVARYWSAVKGFTVWRENVMRLAAYRHFAKDPKLESLMGVSSQGTLQGVKGEDRAAKLARELLGDYGNISEAGQWLRRHMIPFYSFVEINAPRYYRLMKNLPAEQGGLKRAGRTSAVAAARLGWTGTKTIAKAHVLFTLATLWNRLMFPEEEEKTRREGEKLHLILGRNEDGSIRSIRFQGALSDALEWFGLDDYPQDIAGLIHGEKTKKDIAAEAVKAPIEKFVQGYEPFTKTLIEEATGRSTYPRLFERGSSFNFRSNPIRDRKEHALRLFSLDGLYRTVTGKPSPPVSKEFPWSILDMGVTYRTDPNEAAYWQVRTKVAKFAKDKGKETGGPGDPTDRQNALYYFKKATQWGDEKAAKKWLGEYEKLGGTAKGMEQSLRLSHPLGGLARKHWQEFRKSLSADEAAQLKQAEDWYERIYNYKPKPITGKEKSRWRREERKARRENKTSPTEKRYNVQVR